MYEKVFLLLTKVFFQPLLWTNLRIIPMVGRPMTPAFKAPFAVCSQIAMLLLIITPWTFFGVYSMDLYFPWQCCMACKVLVQWSGTESGSMVLTTEPPGNLHLAPSGYQTVLLHTLSHLISLVCKVVAVIPIIQMGRLRSRALKWFAQGHTDSKGRKWDLNSL